MPLITFDERSRTLLVYNDAVAEGTGELEYLDYLQGHVSRRANHFVTRHGFAELALSETTATSVLRKNAGAVVPNNLPERRRAHVHRPELEASLQKYLLDDKHRIVSLDGRGGVGKTYLATEVCQRIASNPAAATRFDFILWMSARDIDLTSTGPACPTGSCQERRRAALRDRGIRFERSRGPSGRAAAGGVRGSMQGAASAAHARQLRDVRAARGAAQADR